MFRALYTDDLRLISFLSYAYLEAGRPGPGRGPDPEVVLHDIGLIDALVHQLVRQAIERHEVDPSPGVLALATLIQTLSVGISLVAPLEDRDFLGMLDAFDLLIDGVLLSGPGPTNNSVATE